jgi:predicted nucleic acid-binding Zn ribbon protein
MRHTSFNPLSHVLDEALRKLDLTEAALEARAVMLWPEIVGPQVARASEARKVQGGTLLVVTRSSAWNQELGFQKEAVLRSYKERLGKAFVRDLRCTVGPVRGVAPAHAEPPPAEVARIRLSQTEIEQIRRASQTEDPELSQAIRRALTREAQVRQWQLEHGARPCPRCGAAYRTSQPLCPACRQDDATAGVPG